MAPPPFVEKLVSFHLQPMFEQFLVNFRGPKTSPTSRNTKKRLCSHELFRKVRVNICLIPCDQGQEPNGHCSEELVQVNVFILGGFYRVDFPPVRFESV